MENVLHRARPIQELKADPDKLLTRLRRSRKPLLLVKNGKPQVMMFDVRKLPLQNNVSEFERLLDEAEADVAAGRVEDCDEYIKRLCDAYKVL